MNLQKLYSPTFLKQGMIYLTESIKQHNPQFYCQEIAVWMEQTNYLAQERQAMELKRSGDFAGSMNIYEQLFAGKPHFSRIHYSAFKTLAASGQIKEAYQAIQLWCLAIVPDVVFQNIDQFLTSGSNRLLDLDAQYNSTLCKHLYLWPTTAIDPMYHLGTCKMIVSGFLNQPDTQAYLASLAGRVKHIEHDSEEAIKLGMDTAAQLPWEAIANVTFSTDGSVWNYIISATYYALRYRQYSEQN